LDALALHGKKILIKIIAVLVCWVAAVSVVQAICAGPLPSLKANAGRISLCGLLILGYDGHLWAKRIAEVLLIIGGFFEIIALPFSGPVPLLTRGFMAADGVVAATAASILLSSFSITAYTTAQRKSRLTRHGILRWI
jgi:hypothetical protein